MVLQAFSAYDLGQKPSSFNHLSLSWFGREAKASEMGVEDSIADWF